MKPRNLKYPKLTLVGAGPGDPELITLKAINALKQADVILYDALVNPELLNHAPVHIPKLYVGKRKGQHSYTQEQINSLIIDSAFSHGHVVRLKGGDPFVFGRGNEEIQYASLFNIETAVIPGISSALAVPALQGIPLTHRGASEGFWVITGTTGKGTISSDIRLAAASNSTLVVLMGISQLGNILMEFRAVGKDDTPVAILLNGTLANEKVYLGTVDTIETIVSEESLNGPGILVFGEVVKQHQDFPASLADWKYLLN